MLSAATTVAPSQQQLLQNVQRVIVKVSILYSNWQELSSQDRHTDKQLESHAPRCRKFKKIIWGGGG